MHMHAFLPRHRDRLAAASEMHPLSIIDRITDAPIKPSRVCNGGEKDLSKAAQSQRLRRRWHGAAWKGEFHRSGVAIEFYEAPMVGVELFRLSQSIKMLICGSSRTTDHHV